MSDLAILVEGLGKRYRIGALQRRYDTLRERLTAAMLTPARRIKAVLSGHSTIVSDEHIWAVQNVSISVQRGEVVGIIGRNGAGKTTLLKLLSRITTPTAGRAELRGRVASLLEVGTGFHPELTGRENIYLNGAILGMTRSEIAAKFDDIVAFAEVERFIDTQVKHYSSGMYLRLAFAVAAHLEPEILLVDEVLAVGDASFQRKCLGKMGDVASSGRTVLFVSHNMEAVQRLCERAIWLDGGEVSMDGSTAEVVASYLHQWNEELESRYIAADAEAVRDSAVLLETEVLDSQGESRGQLRFGEPFAIRMHWLHREPIKGLSYFLRVFDSRERLLFTANTFHEEHLGLDGAGEHQVICNLPNNVLVPGDYTVTVGCSLRPRPIVHCAEQCLAFSVTPIPHDGDLFHIHQYSIIAPRSSWRRVEAVVTES